MPENFKPLFLKEIDEENSSLFESIEGSTSSEDCEESEHSQHKSNKSSFKSDEESDGKYS